MPYTYYLKCSDGSYYTGWTVDLIKRLEAHNRGTASKYTRSRLPVDLVYWEEHESRSEAQKREEVLRKKSRRTKETIIMEFANTHKIP